MFVSGHQLRGVHVAHHSQLFRLRWEAEPVLTTILSLHIQFSSHFELRHQPVYIFRQTLLRQTGFFKRSCGGPGDWGTTGGREEGPRRNCDDYCRRKRGIFQGRVFSGWLRKGRIFSQWFCFGRTESGRFFDKVSDSYGVRNTLSFCADQCTRNELMSIRLSWQVQSNNSLPLPRAGDLSTMGASVCDGIYNLCTLCTLWFFNDVE